MDDLISRAYVLAEYDRQHKGPPGGARKIIEEAPAVGAVPVVRCKDCKHFEIKDIWGNFGGVPILAASDVPTCNMWSDGCMTKPDGYCFMGERRKSE